MVEEVEEIIGQLMAMAEVLCLGPLLDLVEVLMDSLAQEVMVFKEI